MRLRTLLALLLSTVVAVAAGCGGGGGGASGGSTASVAGVASKGPINGGTVQAFQIFSSHDPNKARVGSAYFTGTTGADGSYTIPVAAGNTKDSIVVVITGGVYKDEATQLNKNLADEYPGGMRAIFPGPALAGQNLKMAVSPFTEMAVRDAGNVLDDNSVKAAHDKIEHAFGLDLKGIDIVLTQPLDPSAAPPAGTDDSRKAYTKALGVLSQLSKNSGVTMNVLSDDLKGDIESHNGLLSATTNGLLLSADLSYSNSGNDLTGVGPVVVPTVAVSPASPITGVIGGSAVTITATVTTSGNPVVGTEVKFAVKSGTGALSGKSALTAADGTASVTLSGTVNNEANVVTATAGGVATDSAVITFITQPTLALVKIVGSGAGNIAGVQALLNYPTGSYTISPTDVTTGGNPDIKVSGAGTGSLIGNANTAGQVQLGLITTSPFAAGEFATLTFHIPASNTAPKASDFAIAAGATVTDLTGTALPITLSTSVSFQ